MIASTRLRWTALAVVAGLVVSATVWQLAFSGAGPQATNQPARPANEGDRRHQVLRDLTEVYVSRGKDVSERMRGGLELAPAAFLNAELERQGAKWRVEGEGSDIAFFDIS